MSLFRPTLTLFKNRVSIIVPSRYRNIVDSGNHETAEVIMEHLLEIIRLDISDGLGCKVKLSAFKKQKNSKKYTLSLFKIDKSNLIKSSEIKKFCILTEYIYYVAHESLKEF